LKRIAVPLVALLLVRLSICAPAFAAGVPSLDSAVLTWTAPTTNTDGSALMDIIGFNVYHGTSPNSMMMAASLAASTTSFVDSGLTPSVWYWYVTAVNALGTESAPSAMVSKTIAVPAPSAASAAAAPRAPRASGASGVPSASVAPSASAATNASSATGISGDAVTPDVPGSAGDSDRAAEPRALSRWYSPDHPSLCRPRGMVWCFRP
jgi:hypothetical protein